MTLDIQFEAVLFVSAQPLASAKLERLLGCTREELESAAKALADRLSEHGSALMLVMHHGQYELVTRPELAELVETVVHVEVQSDLSRPALETLAILAYRGPLSRAELEQIRGVQSSLILRNLMLRGLVEMREDVRLGQPTYVVTIDFIKHLGLPNKEALPEYEALHRSSVVEEVLQELAP